MSRRARRWSKPALVGALVAGLGATALWLIGDGEDPAATDAGTRGQAAQTSTTVPLPPVAPSPTSTAVVEPAPPAPSALAAALDAVWARTPTGCLRVSSGGRVVYERGGEGLVAPASAIKIVTGATALEVLGADARLRTSVRVEGLVAAGSAPGDLWIVGGGDPVLATAAWAAHQSEPPLYTSLDALADQVVEAGVRRIEGSVIGDDSRHEGSRYLPTWPQRLIADGEIGPLSALSVNDGFRVWGHPGVPFEDPPREAAGVFTALLRERGVEVIGAPQAGAAPDGVEIAAVDSPTIGELVATMLRESDNGTAEALLREIGFRSAGEGSTAAGVRGVREALARQGVQMDGSVLADGSGLSDADRLTCSLLTAVLDTSPSELRSRLAVAGRTGTLERRFAGLGVAGRIRAKTGSLDGIVALAGYADNVHGQVLSFAYVANGLPKGAALREAQNELAVALVRLAP